MRFRFIGDYPAGRETIAIKGVTFTGREPVEVADAALRAHFAGHSEIEAVTAAPTPSPAASRSKSPTPRSGRKGR